MEQNNINKNGDGQEVRKDKDGTLTDLLIFGIEVALWTVDQVNPCCVWAL